MRWVQQKFAIMGIRGTGQLNVGDARGCWWLAGWLCVEMSVLSDVH